MTLSESLTDICLELNNWFDRGQRCFGTFAVSNKELSGFSDKLKPGQFYRIIGSVFNDGVHQYGDADSALTDETFDGAVWAMSVKPDVLRLAAEIAAWRELYDKADSPTHSPISMESFGGYTRQLRGGMSGAENGVMTWQSVFAARLNQYRKF